jgi:hypothetical protein
LPAQDFPDGVAGQSGEAAIILDDQDAIPAGSPEGRIGGAPKDKAGETDGCGKVGDSGVVADEMGTAPEQGRDLLQGPAAEDAEAWGGQTLGQSIQSIALGFPADEQDVAGGVLERAVEQFEPASLRPVLGFGTAAGMDRHPGSGAGRRRAGVQTWHGIGFEDGEIPEWFEKRLDGVRAAAFVGTMRSPMELGSGTAPDVLAEDAIGIVEVGQDDVEPLEERGHGVVEFAVAREESGQGPGFDGVQFRDEISDARYAGDGGVAENLD